LLVGRNFVSGIKFKPKNLKTKKIGKKLGFYQPWSNRRVIKVMGTNTNQSVLV